MQPIDKQLAARLTDAFAAVLNLSAGEIDPAVRPATDPKFGDYQSNAAMALAKRAKANPRQLAQQAVAAAKLDDLCDPPEIAGPGFINLRLKTPFVAAALAAMAGDQRLGVESAASPESIVIDFSSPNISKEMHIGHLRSTVLGDVLARTLEFLGHSVHRQNHIGDWGTQFGMLLAYIHSLDQVYGEKAYSQDIPELRDLEEFYRKAKVKFDSNPEFASVARYTVKVLQGKNLSPEESIVREGEFRLWKQYRRISLAHCESIYQRLDVTLTPENVRGESAYNDDLPKVLSDLEAKGLLKDSEGAQCVFLEGFINKDGNPLPFMVRKSDGGFLYATTDLAALRYRASQFHPNRILYVVDARQSQHFVYLFAVARKAGFVPESVELTHIAFGTIQGSDGKPFKTKSGESVKLATVLDEAEQRAARIVEQKNPELSAEEKANIARVVGIGAIKYFDLSNNRISDYKFDWDQMLALTGNTAPYLQYAYARIRSIFRKAEAKDEGPSAKDEEQNSALRLLSSPPALSHEHELALAKHLLRYGEAVGNVVKDYRPNILCDYLYELAGRFTGFYENCPVLKADEPTRIERLLLCDLTARVLKHGLGLLGIDVIEQM